MRPLRVRVRVKGPLGLGLGLGVRIMPVLTMEKNAVALCPNLEKIYTIERDARLNYSALDNGSISHGQAPI